MHPTTFSRQLWSNKLHYNYLIILVTSCFISLVNLYFIVLYCNWFDQQYCRFICSMRFTHVNNSTFDTKAHLTSDTFKIISKVLFVWTTFIFNSHIFKCCIYFYICITFGYLQSVPMQSPTHIELKRRCPFTESKETNLQLSFSPSGSRGWNLHQRSPNVHRLYLSSPILSSSQFSRSMQVLSDLEAFVLARTRPWFS